MSNQWQVSSFGNDCMGNITGYRVDRYVWVPSPYSKRSDGLWLEHQIASGFCGDIYEPGSFERARQAAKALATKLNGAMG